MICAMRSKVIVIVLLCICINLTIADRKALCLQRRDEPTISSKPSSNTASDTATTVSKQALATSSTQDNNGDEISTLIAVIKTTDSYSVSESTISTTSTSSTAVASSLNGAPSSSISYNSYNSTLTPNNLPIEPKITPAFAIAGVILMVTGAVYAFVGIKNKLLHVFFSAAYLASISVLVLIIYVMNLPVSNAIQGAYLVAIVITGAILGGAALIVTEMTEGLGCLLGGFCFSMWLLSLLPGGLLTETSSKAIFIGVFTLAAFAASFSRYTRSYGLITSISFSGATAIVLGLDCFSRAGLKEFWVYLWALNNNLFPVGATTYPLTRGIRVETAAIMVLFLAGILSQMKLWKIIQKHREQQADEKKAGTRKVEEEEENLGIVLQHANAQEQIEWEAVYGDRNRADSSAKDSGIGDMESQKKGSGISVRTRSIDDEEIELVESPRMMSGISKNGHQGTITVRVARDLSPQAEAELQALQAELALLEASTSPKQTLAVHGSEKGENKFLSDIAEENQKPQPTRKSSKRKSVPTTAPVVVPLPFKVSEREIDDNASSVATYADEDREPRGHVRRSSSRRLSAASALIRKLSKKSQRSSRSYSIGEGASTEDLIVPHTIEEDRRSSLAATMDGLSDDEDMLSVRLSLDEAPGIAEGSHDDNSSVAAQLLVLTTDSKRPTSEAVVATNYLDPESDKVNEVAEPTAPVSLTSSTDPKTTTDSAETAPIKTERVAKDKSVISETNSGSNSITKDRLPPQLSKVVMSYRTNEWAKHLETADAPEVDELKLAQYPVKTSAYSSEKAVPVNIKELQQTATNATLPPAPRVVSQMPYHNTALAESALASKGYPANLSNPAALLRSVSQQSTASQANSLAKGSRSSSQPHTSLAIVESPIEAKFPAHSFVGRFLTAQNQTPFAAPGTLLGKRDTMIRNKTNSFYAGHQQPGSTATISNQYPQYASRPVSLSRGTSDAGSMYNYQTTNSILPDDDEDMSLATRRDLIRQSTILQAAGPPSAHQNSAAFDSHQPRRQSSIPSAMARDQQMASWRASVQQDLQSGVKPKVTIEQQRSVLWHERQQDEQRKAMEEWKKNQRDSAFDERMRRGDMLDAHKEALMKMQMSANRNAHESSH